jgi:hypothetical protein
LIFASRELRSELRKRRGTWRSDKYTADKVLEAIKGTGGMVLKTSLDDSKEKALSDAIAAPPPPPST